MTLGRPAHPLNEHGGTIVPPSAHTHGDRRRSRKLGDVAIKARAEALAAYERAWSGVQDGPIRAELARCWTSHSTHVGPFTDPVHGVDGLTKLILEYPAMFPGARFRVTSVPDLHHDVARFAWRLDSTARIRINGHDFGHSVEGLSAVDFDRTDRIQRMIVFFGPLAHRPQAGAEVETSSNVRPGVSSASSVRVGAADRVQT